VGTEILGASNRPFEKKEKKMKKQLLDAMPFDKVFYVDGNEEFCHATGYEVYFGEDGTNDPADWWNEYIDSNGDYQYGR
jgi:hypothetical protein